MRAAHIVLSVALIAVAAWPSNAHEHATGVVKERMDAMTDMAKRNKSISQWLRSKRDLADIKADAEAIASHAGHIAHLFPQGSTAAPTRAKAAIWQDFADFEGKAKALEEASRALAATSASDAAALTAAATAMTRACTACHEKYRTRR